MHLFYMFSINVSVKEYAALKAITDVNISRNWHNNYTWGK